MWGMRALYNHKESQTYLFVRSSTVSVVLLLNERGSAEMISFRAYLRTFYSICDQGVLCPTEANSTLMLTLRSQ